MDGWIPVIALSLGFFGFIYLIIYFICIYPEQYIKEKHERRNKFIEELLKKNKS